MILVKYRRALRRSEGLTMQKIAMKTPLVEMDGDDMTRVLWTWIKEMLREP